MRPTSCRLRAAAGVINGAPTTRRHQDNQAERESQTSLTPRDGPPNIHHLRPTTRRLHTKRRGAIYDARHPAGRNHRRTQHARDGPPNTSRLSVRPTSCRLRAATGVINGAPTTHRHQDNPTGRNRRRTQHAPLRHANAKTDCGPTVPTEKLAFPCPGSRLCVSLHQANGKMPAAVP